MPMISREQLLERGRDLFGVGRLRSESQQQRDQILLGAIAVLMVAVVAAALALVYLRPFGYSQYRAELSNASGLRPGDQVRVAGILVGQVDSVGLEGNRVVARFSVKTSVRVGDESSLSIRMLTPVGGRFAALAPRGGAELGANSIPAERVTGTYDMSAIIEQSTPKIEPLDGQTGRKIVELTRSAVSGNNAALTELIDASVLFAEQMSTRTEQLQGALRVSDEYVAATAADREIVFTLIDNLAKIGVGLGVRYDQVRRVFNLLARLFGLLDRIATFYEVGFEQAIDAGANLLSRLKPAVDSVEGTLREVDRSLENLRSMITSNGLTINNSQQIVRGMTVCVPNPARGC